MEIYSHLIGVFVLALHNLNAFEIAVFAVPAVCCAFVPNASWRSLAALLLLPAVWIALAFWAAVFWAPHIQPPDGWVTYPVYGALPLFDVLTLYLVWRRPDLRVATVAFAGCNMGIATRVMFVSGMAVTGIWL